MTVGAPGAKQKPTAKIGSIGRQSGCKSMADGANGHSDNERTGATKQKQAAPPKKAPRSRSTAGPIA